MKRLICLISALILVFTLLIPVSYADVKEQIEVYVDGVLIEFDVQPVYDQYHSMIPIRAIADKLDIEIIWNGTEQTATLLSQKGTIVITIGSNRIITDGERTASIWSPAQLIDGRTLINYRNISDIFNVHTYWDENKFIITTDNSLYDVMQKKEIVVGIDGVFPPMGFADENGEYVGFDVDLAREASKRLGVELKIEVIDFSALLLSLTGKKVDIVWNSLTVTEQRKTIALFSDPYIQDGLVLVAKNDSQITTRTQLENSKIGYLSSYEDYGLWDDSVINDNIRTNLKEFNSEAELLNALDSGEIDAFFAWKIEAQHSLTKDSEKYKLLDFLFDKEDYAVAFRKNDIYLRDAVQKTIDEMKKDGTYNEILSKWFGKDRVNHISYDGNLNIVYNGDTYRLCEDYHWRAGETGERLGAVAQWGDYLKFNHLGMEFEAGVFEVKNSNGGALHINPPESEFDALYLRSDIKVPEMTADSIDRIELTNSYMGYDHITCNNGTTDKEVIKEIMNLLLFSEGASIDTPYSSRQTVLLYSDEMPGCIYPILLYEKDGISFLELGDKLVIITEELLSKIVTAETCSS